MIKIFVKYYYLYNINKYIFFKFKYIIIEKNKNKF